MTQPPFRLWRWIVAGAALDAFGLVGVSAVVVLRTAQISMWEMGAVSTVVPWIVHVIVLPLMFRRVPVTWMSAARLLIGGAGLVASATLIVPILGVATFWALTAFSYLLVIAPLRAAGVAFNLPDAVVVVLAYLLFLLPPAIVGGFVGSIGCALRPTGRNGAFASRQITLRPDVLGGAIAGPAMWFMWGALGQFKPVLATAVGTIGLLPHLAMIGLDLRRSAADA